MSFWKLSLSRCQKFESIKVVKFKNVPNKISINRWLTLDAGSFMLRFSSKVKAINGADFQWDVIFQKQVLASPILSVL